MEKVSLTFDDFENLLNTNIKIRFENNITLDSELIELEKLPKYSEFSGQPFYFILRTLQTTEYYQQATYLLLHPTKGEIPVFLVPLGLDHIGMKYQAIFN